MVNILLLLEEEVHYLFINTENYNILCVCVAHFLWKFNQQWKIEKKRQKEEFAEWFARFYHFKRLYLCMSNSGNLYLYIYIS